MALGKKTGGRVAGTPNRRTQDVIERLAALNCDPIEGMARIAIDEANAPELRGRMFAELASYVAPKRKAVEHSAEDGSASVSVSWMSREDVRSSSRPMPPAATCARPRISRGCRRPLHGRIRGAPGRPR